MQPNRPRSVSQHSQPAALVGRGLATPTGVTLHIYEEQDFPWTLTGTCLRLMIVWTANSDEMAPRVGALMVVLALATIIFAVNNYNAAVHRSIEKLSKRERRRNMIHLRAAYSVMAPRPRFTLAMPTDVCYRHDAPNLQDAEKDGGVLRLIVDVGIDSRKKKSVSDRAITAHRFPLVIFHPCRDPYVSNYLKVYGIFDLHVYRLAASLLDEAPLHSDDRPLMLDVGANLGFFGMYAAHRGCRVRAFEIQSLVFHSLQMSAAVNGFSDDQYKAHRLAVSSPSADGSDYIWMPVIAGGNIGGVGLSLSSGCGGRGMSRPMWNASVYR